MSSHQFPPDPARYPEASQATTALVLGILGLIICQILAPFAWLVGNREIAAIDAGLRPPDNRSTANAGRILGIIGTVLMGFGIVVLLLLLAGSLAVPFTFGL